MCDESEGLLFQSLLGTVRAAQVKVYFCSKDPDDENFGFFKICTIYVQGTRSAVDRGVIRLFRGSLDAGTYVGEIISLAHEFGHALSWRDGFPTKKCAEDYDDIRNSLPVSYDATREILREEFRAWRRARRVLETLQGFTSFCEFEIRRTNALESYRIGLNLALDDLAHCERDCERAENRI